MKKEPLFELHGPNGEEWKLFENGEVTGFPDGTWLVNHAAPLMDLMRGRIKQLETSTITGQEL